MSTAQRRSRIVRAPAARATALVVAGVFVVSGLTTQAAPVDPADKEAKEAKAAAAAKVLAAAKEVAAKEAAAAEAAAKEPIPVLEGGKVVGEKTAEAARKEGLTVVDRDARVISSGSTTTCGMSIANSQARALLMR